MTLQELQCAKNDLQAAIYSGALEVRFGERWIRYQTTVDMQKALADLNNEIANALAPSSGRSMCNFTQFNG